MLTEAWRLFPETHAAFVRQRRRSSVVTESRGRACAATIKPRRSGGGNKRTEPDRRQSKSSTDLINMVKITFQPVSAQKPEKDNDPDKITLPQPYEKVIPHVKPGQVIPSRKPFPIGLCCLAFGLLVFLTGLVLASVYTYRHYFIPQHIPEDSLFHCRVIYEDSIFAPLRGRQELEENVGIYIEDNYEQISVPVPHFGGSDPADIVHDFQRGLTAYFDIALDKCYITELNTTLVMPPRSLWELLINVKRGTYLPQTYIIQEEMAVTGRVRNMRQLGPFIHRLCFGKETYRLRRRNQRQRIERRETKRCHKIRHFENTFVVETVICDRF
uniref:Integral membrane protein 2 n=1 Tax=Oryzias latipes TaxID=8090 RepID=A0A3P9HU66_ORYLA